MVKRLQQPGLNAGCSSSCWEGDDWVVGQPAANGVRGVQQQDVGK
jgi:hypothetical protein